LANVLEDAQVGLVDSGFGEQFVGDDRVIGELDGLIAADRLEPHESLIEFFDQRFVRRCVGFDRRELFGDSPGGRVGRRLRL
jgi:hypothetical protein